MLFIIVSEKEKEKRIEKEILIYSLPILYWIRFER